MNRMTVTFTAALLAVSAAASFAAEGKRSKGTFQAQRAGWLMGMYIGEEREQQYPFVLQVAPKSDARNMGVKPGDELIRFEGGETTPLRRLFDQVNEMRPGKLVTLWVRRGVQTVRFQLTVPKNPSAAPVTEEAAAKGSGEQAADGEKDKKKKAKKRAPVVVKPIPAGE